MRISRDVIVQVEDTAGELSVVSHGAGVIGEELTLGVVHSGGDVQLRVRVVESRPLMVAGVVRHRVRLAILPRSSAPGTETRRA